MMTKYFNTGDIVKDEEGRTLEITSGNMKWRGNKNALADWNRDFLRAKIYNKQVKTLWDLNEVDRDFLYYQNRIVRVIRRAEHGISAAKTTG